MECDLLFEIKKLNNLMMQHLMKGKDLGKHPSPTQMRIMQYMKEHEKENIYQKDLEHHLNISRATISDVLNTMEKNGIIERINDEIDTRTKIVRFSKKAYDLHNQTKKEIEALTEKMIYNISVKDIEIFKRILKQMEDNLS